MKKTLLAAALTLGFAGVAQAETSVTLFGVLDGGIGYQKVKMNEHGYLTGVAGSKTLNAKRTGMINSVYKGNRWGLKGVEDLGDGLRVVFHLESGFDLGTGTSAQGIAGNWINQDFGANRLFGRQATLGLASDSWGQFDIGRQTNIASKYVAPIVSPFGASFGQAAAGATFTSANTVRWDNMFMYQTPNFSGFQFGAGYSFNTNGSQTWKTDADPVTGWTGDDDNVRGITAGLRYANGPVAVALTYDQTRHKFVNNAGNGVDSTTVSAWALAGSYDFEVAKVHLGFGQTRNGYFAAEQFGGGAAVGIGKSGTADGLKFNSYTVGVSAPVGGGNLMASWAMNDPRSTPKGWDAINAGLVGTGTSMEMKKQQIYSLGYTYGLSKRTTVYAIGSYAKNAAFIPGAKSQLIGVGLTHDF